MKSRRIGVRLSAELYTLLLQTGELSAAVRALALLGAHTAGYDISLLRHEAASLLATHLDAPVRTALWALLREDSAGVPHLSDNGSPSVEPMLNRQPEPAPAGSLEGDPFNSIGFDV